MRWSWVQWTTHGPLRPKVGRRGQIQTQGDDVFRDAGDVTSRFVCERGDSSKSSLLGTIVQHSDLVVCGARGWVFLPELRLIAGRMALCPRWVVRSTGDRPELHIVSFYSQG